MVITLKREGGFAPVPGLSKPKTLDTGQLSSDEAGAVEEMVSTANFFALPATVSEPKRGAADVRTFEITVSDGERSHTVRAAEPIEDPALQALVRYVQKSSRS